MFSPGYGEWSSTRNPASGDLVHRPGRHKDRFTFVNLSWGSI